MNRTHALAVLLDDGATLTAHAHGGDAWWLHLHEILQHQRLPYTTAAPRVDDAVRVALAATPSTLGTDDVGHLRAWVHRGGSLVLLGDPGAAAELAGVRVESHRDHGHVSLEDREPWTDLPTVALHAVGGTGLTAEQGTDVVARWDDGLAAITVRPVGSGVVVAVGPDLCQSVVRIQQGYPVAEDGAPPSDGTAPVDDGLLKAEDGLALDFLADRSMPPGEPDLTGRYPHTYPPTSAVPVFAEPHADLWRSVLLQVLWWASERAGTVLPWLYYWPAGVPAVAHMSHDADRNDPEDGWSALAAFEEAGVAVTWCQVYPGGYGAELYAAIGAAGHEHALHYNAMGDSDIASWGWPHLRAQYAWAQAVTGTEDIVSNKNHYTRWEGWSEFYGWCERVGIQIDQSRGGSKQGTVGFPFGTAHVGFPMGDVTVRNRPMNVLNLPLHAQDLATAAHEAARDVILDAALAQRGVAHFLFHGPHLRNRPQTRRACIDLAQAARDRKMPWWTSAEINDWERARRTVELRLERGEHSWTLHVGATSHLSGAALLVPVPAGVAEDARVESTGPGTVGLVRHHGRLFVELAVDIEAGWSSWVLSVPDHVGRQGLPAQARR